MRVSVLLVLALYLQSCPAASRAAEFLSGGKLHFLLLTGQSNTPNSGEANRIREAVSKAFPGDEVIIARASVGACPICGFYKGWKPAPGWEKLPDQARRRVEVEATGKVWDEKVVPAIDKALGDRWPDTVTFLWMQGERDGLFEHNAKVYEASLKGLIRQIREHLDRDDVHFCYCPHQRCS